MVSGNFIIGKDLSLDGFNEYIKPHLEKREIKLTDFMIFNGNTFKYDDLKSNKNLLISLISKLNLEEKLKESFLEAKNIFNKTDYDHKKDKTYSFQIFYGDKPYIETLGVYENDKTASKVYQNLAIKYSSIEADNFLDEFENKLKNFGEKLSPK